MRFLNAVAARNESLLEIYTRSFPIFVAETISIFNKALNLVNTRAQAAIHRSPEHWSSNA
jgi:hypothetical protein